MKNMVAVGGSIALLGVTIDAFQEVIEERFSRKGAKIVEKNMEAITKGNQFVQELITDDFPDLR